MIREGEGMQVPWTLHLKGDKKFIDILKKELSGRASSELTHFLSQRKTEYMCASKYIQ